MAKKDEFSPNLVTLPLKQFIIICILYLGDILDEILTHFKGGEKGKKVNGRIFFQTKAVSLHVVPSRYAQNHLLYCFLVFFSFSMSVECFPAAAFKRGVSN